MKTIYVGIILIMLVGLVMDVAFAYELTRAELILTDVSLEPQHPQAGDKVAILASLYNGGTVDTNYFASVVTVGYFIDGELRKITELQNIKPGLSNAITITSGKFWDAELGNHNMTVVIDYHNTLPDNIDESTNNKMQKTFLIEPYKKSKITFDVFPQFVIPTKDTTLTINGSLTEFDSDKPLTKQLVHIKTSTDVDTLVTDKDGKFKITKALIIPKGKSLISVSYDGSFPYLLTNSSNFVFNLKPTKETAAIITQLDDPKNAYDFSKLPSTIVIYQDSYQKTYKKFTTNKNTLLDNKTAWMPVEANHSYLEEVYLGGRFFFSSDWKQVTQSQVLQNRFLIPDSAQIRFKVSGLESEQMQKITVKNWIYSDSVDGDGYTKWIETLPSRSKSEPYVATVLMPDGQIFSSAPFFVESGERKVIEITISDQSVVIPAWIKTNAKWWAEGKIPDSDFTNGLGYLIEKKIIWIPPTQPAIVMEQKIPAWIKTNAKWWAEGKINDSDFVKGIQYLIQNGIIVV